MKRIAVFRALQLGDLLVAVPAFRLLRQYFPTAEITLIGLPWAESFVERFSCYIDRFVEFVGYPGIDEVPFDAERTERFFAEQRACSYDIVLQMHGSGRRSDPFVLALGGSSTIGYYEKTPAGLTLEVPYPNDQHEIWRNLHLVQLLAVGTDSSRPLPQSSPFPGNSHDEVGTDSSCPLAHMNAEKDEMNVNRMGTDSSRPFDISIAQKDAMNRSLLDVSGTKSMGAEDAINRSLRQLEFPLFEGDYAEADVLLRPLRGGNRRIVGIHPGARPPARRWPSAYFASVADELAYQFDVQIVLTGGPGEEQMVQEVMDAMHLPALSLVGKTSLGGLAALLKGFDLFISNDTGPSHLACAVDCPSITLFGPADVQRWVPLESDRHPIVRQPVACSPCGYWECPIDHRCLRWLTPESVFMKAAGMMQKERILTCNG